MKELVINGKTYKPMADYAKCDGIFSITDNIKDGEYAPFFSKVIFRDNGVIKACYKDNFKNTIEL